MQIIYTQQLTATYQKALVRLEKNISTGKFTSYTQLKKQKIWTRLCRYARQLGISIKNSLVTACVAAGLLFATSAVAQPFVEQTGAANPFNGVNEEFFTSPTFVDIDGDGDKDIFIGKEDSVFDDHLSKISYYKNTGTSAAPLFTAQVGISNPFNAGLADDNAKPAFVDIDGDGDLDAFIGSYNSTIFYYKNTGTAAAPVYIEQTGASNPFNGNDLVFAAAPAFVDIDGDGDLDAFVGESYGSIIFYKNTGSATTPVFTLQSGAASPFNGVDVGDFSTPVFADIDGDGDMDAIIGEYYGFLQYYKNTGSAIAPVFALQTGNNNPFDGVFTGYLSSPALADIDNDGDIDVFTAEAYGSIKYFKNMSIVLPLHLLTFTGSSEQGFNLLQWQTAGEINTKSFEVQSSSDGRNFKTVLITGSIPGNNNNYTIHDNVTYSGKVFYRLKIIDVDGRFTYSHVIWINAKNAAISIYPNPVTSVINVNTGSLPVLKKYAHIYDAGGRLMQSVLVNTTQQQINVQALTKGRYLIKFADGTVQSFIKE